MGKRQSRVHIATAEQPANDQLGIGTESSPRPNVASGRRSGLGVLYVVVLGVNERPDFIHLDALAGQIAKGLVLIGRASVAGGNKQLRDGVFAASGQARNGADRLSLAKEVEDLGTRLSVQLVHG